LELPNVSDSEGQTSGGKQPLRDSRIEAAFNFDFWSYFTLLPCLDGKYRRTQPGIHPLAAGVPSRLGKLRGYGNAIVPPLAARFILSFEEAVKSTLG
jgi:hypothetical protein